jgi:hypothetical protein
MKIMYQKLCLPETIVENAGALTPLQQFKAGIDANDVLYPANLELVVSPSSPKPLLFNSCLGRNIETKIVWITERPKPA